MVDTNEVIFAQRAACRVCIWRGTAGDLIASGQLGGLRCPDCDSDNIYVSKQTDARKALAGIKAGIRSMKRKADG